ncbi:hypothetical protein CcaverHIS002_0602140 [Cutaneotrichosporon cavernicola]|uniref:GH16 domain-containing protein n=1 Tax=Cutaneotrichosporon cavernicola TaxID=279322 RepID=A0AA48QXU5_9TREE|nr:uncharacterized protein CcaverHIS019_0601640 [Cutaneotrichosporon cavernicola]BEI85927.1 hypothetical protein CcaverHIS002_0602140 [Cutaneotrichosporon cavernicola]BEI93705.1 hypothetical protein CcaverHIS019_0601640 [Cutaneotrichosporon cavernicola]BEJ01482.1 hypothetical protein CcaverHIS631_0601640 [Cutaneotrichosporon cavernicola]BEJ09248.1 hypothetical protein CcaverHIS641_0601630 [Cutaneotrichosporon cavernicola]
MLSLLQLIPLLPFAAAATYPLVDSHKGETFLDGFKTPSSVYDNTTSGDVFWAAKGNSSVMYLNDAGRYVLKVDNTSFVPYNEKRFAPSLLTERTYPVGSVFVMDAVHMPYGCSVWPAFWTQGAAWPAGGEIDIMEGVNGQTANQIALHTDSDGCYASQDAQMTGQLRLDNCSVTSNGGSGCTVGDPNTNSYGADFAAAGGGVYVAEYATDGIRVWFKSRADVPKEMTGDAQSLDTSILGTPTANYPSSTCDIGKYFADQILTITITLCGAWAGTQSVLEATCPPLVGTNTCYTTYVINDASETYKNAYFELNYINIYSTAVEPSTTNSSSGSASGSASGAATGGGAKTTSTAGARRALDMPIRLGWAAGLTAVLGGALAFIL